MVSKPILFERQLWSPNKVEVGFRHSFTQHIGIYPSLSLKVLSSLVALFFSFSDYFYSCIKESSVIYLLLKTDLCPKNN